MKLKKAIEVEKRLAKCWYNCIYVQQEVEMLSELQGLSFKNILNEYGKLYHETERLSYEPY